MDDHASKLKGLIWLVAACCIGALFAFGLSPLAHIIPWSWEKRIGSAIDLGMSNKECHYNARADVVLQRMLKRIYPVDADDAAFSIEVKIVKDPIINAYATLGGKITLNSGLIKKAESPEEVTGILAHEIEHVRHRHIMEGTIVHLFTAEGINVIFGGTPSTAQWVKYFLNMDFTRSQEIQADKGGLRRLQKAHVDNQGLKRFFERMEKSESSSIFISDHPSNSMRMEMTEQFKNNDIQPVMTEDDWKILKSYCNER